MIRGTTPTHYFDIKDEGVDKSVISKVNVLYGQDDKLLFKKKTSDCVVEDKTITTKLTRDESLMFDHTKPAQVQLLVETLGGETLETIVEEIGVDKLLDDGVVE